MSERVTVPVPPAGFDPEAIARLGDALGAGEDGGRYIGGWVRDSLLGQLSADVDIATRLLPQAVIDRTRSAGIDSWSSASGLAHGTVGVLMPMIDGGTRTIEVTTLRRDVVAHGRHATIAFTDDWREDASRRDFTINALSAEMETGRVHDHFGGLADLEAGLVRFIGEPMVRIAEDHLRILRFFRFHARFGAGAPDPASLAACAARANDLMALSRERIADELLKLLAAADPVPAVRLMLASGIFRPVLPEIGDAERLARLVAREAALAEPPSAPRRLAALLPPDSEAAGAVAARLRLSNTLRARLERLATPLPRGAEPRRLRADLPHEDVRDLLLLSDRDDADVAATLHMLQDWSPPDFPLKGGNLVALGLRPSPAVAATLARVRAAWIDAGYPEEAWVREKAASEVAEMLKGS